MTVSSLGYIIAVVMYCYGADGRYGTFLIKVPGHLDATKRLVSELRECRRAQIQVSVATAGAFIGDMDGYALPLS